MILISDVVFRNNTNRNNIYIYIKTKSAYLNYYYLYSCLKYFVSCKKYSDFCEMI